MTLAADPVTFSVPRTVLAKVVRLSGELTGRMHDLLERNTEGRLSETEKAELETLVQMAEFSQIISMALEPRPRP